MWVGSAQVLGAEDERLADRACQRTQRYRCRQLLSPQPFGREIRGAVRRQSGMSTSGASRDARPGWVEAGQTQRALRGRRGAVRPAHPHQNGSLPISGDWMERRVLQKLRGAPLSSRHEVFLAQLRRMELLDEPRLAEAGLAYDKHELAFARTSALLAAR